ncbi:hypothetical protein JCM8547_006068 [Rhodosporidiobolus lusitaniae]
MSAAPPSYSASAAQQPPAGLRVPCSSQQPPSQELLGPAPLSDKGGTPVWVCSAIIVSANGQQSVHPAKFAHGKCMYSYGGAEKHHQGRFDILPLTSAMEWVPAKYGEVPKGRRPVEGGFEGAGHLYHALAEIEEGVRVPGKTGGHLHGANFPWAGGEHIREVGYDILCWKQ